MTSGLKINQFRDGVRQPPLKTSPGQRLMLHGKKKGFGGVRRVRGEITDVMDYFDVLVPDLQLMVEVDFLARHAEF